MSKAPNMSKVTFVPNPTNLFFSGWTQMTRLACLALWVFQNGSLNNAYLLRCSTCVPRMDEKYANSSKLDTNLTMCNGRVNLRSKQPANHAPVEVTSKFDLAKNATKQSALHRVTPLMSRESQSIEPTWLSTQRLQWKKNHVLEEAF